MTPLIDIIFQLVIFFMLTTTFVKLEVMDILVQKPGEQNTASSNSGGYLLASREIEISLSGQQIFANGQQITRQQLSEALQDEFKFNPKKPVKIFTQQGVNVQSLISVIDAIRLAGGANISVDTVKQ